MDVVHDATVPVADDTLIVILMQALIQSEPERLPKVIDQILAQLLEYGPCELKSELLAIVAFGIAESIE